MNHLIMIVFGLIGLAIQSFVKINAINDRTPDTVEFGTIFRTYFRKDFPKIGMSILSIFVTMAAIDGWLNLRSSGMNMAIPGASPTLEAKLVYFINIGMTVWGYVSGSFIMSFGSRAERFINDKANSDLKKPENQ